MAPRRITAVAILLVGAAIALASWQHERVLEEVLWMRYWQTLVTPRLHAARDPAQARREDLDFLARLPEVDRSFTGCREWRCYWPNVFRGVAVGTIDPEVDVAWRFEDFARGVDTVLEAALEWPP